MQNLTEKYSFAQLVLAMLMALGMVLTMVHPLAGKIVGLSSGGLIIILYMVLGIRVMIEEKDKSFESTLHIINYFASALTLALIAYAVIFLAYQRLFALLAMPIAFGCLVVNLANRYIYKIRDERYSVSQVRILFLILLCLFLLVK
jgi:hypothetical protein